MTQNDGLGKIRITKIVKILFSISVVSMLGLSTLLIPTNAAPIPTNAFDSYAYVVASPNIVNEGEKTTLTLIGYIYGDGKYNISVEFWETDMFEDRHQSVDSLWTAPITPDLSVGTCTASITVDTADRFECTADVIPSELTKGNGEDEADWTEFYATVSINDDEKTKTGGLELVYCPYCSSDVAITYQESSEG